MAAARRARAELHRRGDVRRCRARAPTTSRSRRTKYLDALPRRRRARSTFTSAARSSTAARTAGCRWSQVPWSALGALRPAGGGVARADRAALPASGWIRLHADTLARLRRRCGRARPAVLRRRASPSCSTSDGRRERRSTSSCSRCSTRATRSTRTRRARPRTRRRRRSASSTRPPTRPRTAHVRPPRSSSAGSPGGGAGASRRRCASCRPTGERHQARGAARRARRAPGEPRVRLSSAPLGAGSCWRSRPTATCAGALRVENATPVAGGPTAARRCARADLDARRAADARRALRLAARGGGLRRTSTPGPVLATDDDDAVLGAAIMLPDHPQLAPESRGDLFDGTEIEEALLLHVHALSRRRARGDRGEQDPAVRGDGRARARGDARGHPAPARALRTAPSEPGPTRRAARREAHPSTACVPAAATAVRCSPGIATTPTTACSTGRTATIERIYVDYDDRVHLGVTVDERPGAAS